MAETSSVPGRLPRWSELPDLEIYMDQVLSLIARYLNGLPGLEEKGLTSSMVNNYVKSGIVPPPVKKRYERAHLAHLIIICILKSTLPIGSIGRLLQAELGADASCEALYDRFCDSYERTTRAVLEAASAPEAGESAASAIFSAALRSQAEQALALRLLDAAAPEKPGRRSR